MYPSRTSCHLALLAAGLIGSFVPLSAQDQTVSGNLTVTGNTALGGSTVSTGAIEAKANNLAVGTGGIGLGSWWAYDNSTSTDTLVNLLVRNSASWLWAHTTSTPTAGTPLPAMRLDASHQLIVYKSDGTTAGVTLTPASTQLALGTATLTGSGTALTAGGAFTATGAFTASAGITNTNGSLTGGASGLTLNAGGTGQSLTLNSSGGDLIFKTNGTERMRVTAAGNLGVGVSSTTRKLEVAGQLYASDAIVSGGVNASLVAYDRSSTGATSLYRTGGVNRLWDSVAGDVIAFNGSGQVGIGTAAPVTRLHVFGGSIFNQTSSGQALFFGGNQDGGTDGKYSAIGMASGGYITFNRASDALVTNEYARFTSSGFLGLGTSSPTELLTLAPNGVIATYRNSAGWILREQRTDATQSRGLYTPDGYGLQMFVNNTPRLTVADGGNVGIGSSSPAFKLEVAGAVAGNFTGLAIYNNDGSSTSAAYSASVTLGRSQAHPEGGLTASNELDGNFANGFLALSTRRAEVLAERVRITSEGNMGIGTTNPGSYKLAVNGTIRAKEVIVDTGWADYVFDEKYRLAPLSEVEAHIKAEKHLPGIPSAQEVETHGVNMGDMQAKLLSKIEELTLHLIEQEKTMQAQQAEITALRNRLLAVESAHTR